MEQDRLQKSVYRVNVVEVDAAEKLGSHLGTLLGDAIKACPLLLCIGTDRSTGDSLGPLVGSMLADSGIELKGRLRILGTLDNPVHAGNLLRSLKEFSAFSGVTVALDACLGTMGQVGNVTVGRGPLKPGAGVRKILPEVGDYFITGTVNIGGFADYLVLQNTRLSLVMKMARVIATGIAICFGLHPFKGPLMEAFPLALPGFHQASSHLP
ncbi:MAG TPA: spore protease YyaC [Firmicutes bacterium]|nr:spore protease YyaC [Bacillota bacterium]